MRLEALEARIDEFDERNLVLQGLLGLVSAARRLDRILARHVPPVPSPAVALHEEDRVLIDFALGLISLRRTLASVVHDAGRGPHSETVTEETSTGPEITLR